MSMLTNVTQPVVDVKLFLNLRTENIYILVYILL